MVTTRKPTPRYHRLAPAYLPRRATSVLEKFFAATIVAGCLVLLLRVFLGERRRGRFDAALARGSQRIGAWIDALVAWPTARRRARREAEAAIRRAREGGEWDGNVYRPKSFRNRRKIH
jgi:hypothetical protein